VSLLLAAVFLLGLARRIDALASVAPLLEDEAPALVRGRVVAEAAVRFGTTEVPFEIDGGWWGEGAWGEVWTGPATPAPRVRVVARFSKEARRRAGDLLPGRRIELAGTLHPPRAPRVPGGPSTSLRTGFDPAEELRRQGASGVLEVEECWKLGGSAPGTAGLVARLGRRARWAIRDAGLEHDEEALVRAMVVGDRGGLSSRAQAAFRSTGLVHAVTVSGIHVALLAWLLGTLLAAFPAVLRGLLVAGGLGLYVALVGPHPGALRAAVGGALLAAAQAWGRGGDSWNRLAVALMASLAWDPSGAEEVGFQLTFGTVAGLLALGPIFRGFAGGGRVRRAFATSLAAFVAHAPLAVARFGILSPVAVVAGVPALPLALATLLFGLAGSTLSCLHEGAGRPALEVAGVCARLLLDLAELAARVPAIQVARPSPLVTALALGLIVFCWASSRRSLRAFVFVGIVLWLGAVIPGGRVSAEAPRVHVLSGVIRIEGGAESLGEGIYRVEHEGTAVLVLDDPGGRELGRVMALVPEGKLRASVLAVRGRHSVALERLVAETRPPLILTATRSLQRVLPGALPGAWTVTLSGGDPPDPPRGAIGLPAQASPGVERYDASR
jgi:ComEC/Rec2-related protein